MKHMLGVALSVVASLPGCAIEGESEADVGNRHVPGQGETVSDLSLGSPVYDRAVTLCNVNEVGGVTMHCCPEGMVMVGIHVGRNVLKCAPLTAGFAGRPHLDAATNRNGMHACPIGELMVGIHVDRNFLACQAQNAPINLEFVDSFTTDGFPMHVCPNTLAMAGIHVDNNLLTCDQ